MEAGLALSLLGDHLLHGFLSSNVSSPTKIESMLSRGRQRKTEEPNDYCNERKIAVCRLSFGRVSRLGRLAAPCPTKGLLSCLEDLEGDSAAPGIEHSTPCLSGAAL